MRILFPVLLLLALTSFACSDSSSPEATPTPSQQAATSTPPEPGPSPQVSPTAGPEPAGPLPSVNLEPVFPDATLSQPTGMYQAPDGRVFILEQSGTLLVFESLEASQPRLFLDLRDRVNDSGYEEGLLGLALAPDFEDSGEFFLYYSAANPRRSVLSRFTSNGDAADPAGELIIMEVAQPYANHNGGQIAFGPDGYLYVALGDGGSGNDPHGNGQDLETLLGSILRIDVSAASESQPYTVPSDNPFVSRAGARPEIWAYGLRNPWRFSFDPETGRMWAGDVGQNAREEVDIIEKGGNYGWSIMEGIECRGGGDSCNRDGLILPVVDYALTGANCAVTGGFVYRGDAIPGLRGAYVYGDYCSRAIWALRYDGSQVTEDVQIGQSPANISSFAVDNDGELYIVGHAPSAGIYRLVP